MFYFRSDNMHIIGAQITPFLQNQFYIIFVGASIFISFF